MPMSAEYSRRYRERIQQQGAREVLLKLPVDTVATIDRLRDAEGAASRSDIVASLIRRALEAENELRTA
jgi:metal-responsive CopG/Arc/MetJ family transcriptional regulator